MTMHCECGAQSTVTHTAGVERRRKCRQCGAAWMTVETRVDPPARPVTQITRIVDTLAERGPMTADELAQAIGTTQKTIAGTMRRNPTRVRPCGFRGSAYLWKAIP
jgi:transcriptional regulator NrdR family protein